MKHVWSVITLGFFLSACAPDPDSHAVVGLGNPDPMQIPCVTNFVRASPNYCQREIDSGIGAISGFTVPGETRCVTIDLTPYVPSSVKVIEVRFGVNIRAANSVNERSIYFGEALPSCSGSRQTLTFTTYEFVARPVGTYLFRGDQTLKIVVDPSMNAEFFAQIIGADISSFVSIKLVGYYD